MSSGIRILSIVSGKGGVGKTVLSANLARMIAFDRKVLLIDFDFPNQGLTGLFADEVRSSCYNARDMIFGSEVIEFDRILTIRPNLFFIPAFDPADDSRFDLRLGETSRPDLLQRIDKMLRLLIESFGVDLVILDCHGGLDSISFSSFALSDRTVIISEPDRVTFNGTLELIDYYEENWATVISGSFTESGPTPPSSKVMFLLNRVSGRFTYDGLIKLYTTEVGNNSRFASGIIWKYLFIPSDSILAQSISEYPFYIELCPESIFCQKLELVYFDLFGTRPRVAGRWLTYKIFERKWWRSLEKQLTSVEEQRTRAVFSFVTMVQFAVLAMITGLAINAPAGFDKGVVEGVALASNHPVITSFMVFLTGLSLIGIAWINLTISRYYRDLARFEFRLFRLGRRRIAAITLVRLVRVISARIYLLVSALTFAISGGFPLWSVLMRMVHAL